MIDLRSVVSFAPQPVLITEDNVVVSRIDTVIYLQVTEPKAGPPYAVDGLHPGDRAAHR